jgi:putative hydrolase of the HAD superfamily
MDRTGIGHHFDFIHTRDDVARAKPFPDLFLAAATSLGVRPEETLVLEDSRNGLRAAVAAGAPCVVVPSPVTDGSDFTDATAILKSLAGVTIAKLREIHASHVSPGPEGGPDA